MAKPPQFPFAIKVQTPGLPWEYYATYAEAPEMAAIAISNKLNTANAKIEFHQAMTEGQAKLIGLTPGSIKKYG